MDTFHRKDNYGASLQSLRYDPTKDPDSPEYKGPTTVKFLTCSNEFNNNIQSNEDGKNSTCKSWIDLFKIPGVCMADIAKHSLPIDALFSSDHSDIRSIRFINFKSFKKFSSFPRYNDNKDICVEYHSIKRQHSLFIYISHTWIANSDGRFEPDNTRNEKFQLVVSAVEKIRATHASDFSHCYVWFDYCCINQETALEYKVLDRIIEACDVILTPIIDDEYDKWDLIDTSKAGFLHDYNASSWNGKDKHSYLSSGWTRLELLLSIAVPLYPDTEVIYNLRKSKAKGAILQAMSVMRRPHFLFGTKEFMNNNVPFLLPGLQCHITELLEQYDPRYGYTSNETDDIHIAELYEKLETYVYLKKKDRASHDGTKNGTTVISEDGTLYKGTFKNDLIQRGKIIYPNGDSYEGRFKNGSFNDRKGKFVYNNGDSYQGEYIDGKRQGLGIFTRAIDGFVEEGVWKDDKLSSKEKCKVM